MSDFEDLGVGRRLAEAASGMGWESPTPVQERAVPPGLKGRDLIVRAQTGTGKTGAYAIITLSRTKAGGDRPGALVIAPTRELAHQVEGEVRRLSKGTGHRCVAVYGGAGYEMQTDRLRRGADVVVGTPGRLRDMADREVLDLSGVGILVLDEADRMMDMGFEDDLRAIMSRLPDRRQTLFLSATMPPGVERLAEAMTRDAEVVDVSSDSPVTGLTKQYYILCDRRDKTAVLRELLERGSPKTVVFCATKDMVDEIYSYLKEYPLEDRRPGTLHGDMSQIMRERILADFRDNRRLVLVATDVAARGLDVPDVDLVVNYDAPRSPETYIHRIGRTGRAGKEGVAVTIVTRRDRDLIDAYEDETGMRIRSATPDDIEPMTAEHPRARREREPRRREPERRSDRAPETVAIAVSLGRDDGLTRTEIADFVADRAGLQSVGRVALGKDASYVSVPADIAEAVIDAVDGSVLNGRKVKADMAPAKTPYGQRIKEMERWDFSRGRRKRRRRPPRRSRSSEAGARTPRGRPRRSRPTTWPRPSTTGARRWTASTRPRTVPDTSPGCSTTP